MKTKWLEYKKMFGVFYKKFVAIVRKPELRILPGNIAFFLVLSFAPLLTLIALFASKFSLPLLSFLDTVKNVFPKDVYNLITTFLSERAPHGSIIIYLILGFILSSNGAHSIILASNMLYNTKDAPALNRRVKSIFLTLILIFEFIFLLVFFVYGNVLLKWVLSFEVFSHVRDLVFSIFIYAKWPIMMFISYLIIKLLYVIAPDKKVRSKKVNRGAIFTTFGWSIITALYAFYVNNLADYNVFYGGLSNLIILMVWIYFVSYLLVLGIALNVSHYEGDV